MQIRRWLPFPGAALAAGLTLAACSGGTGTGMMPSAGLPAGSPAAVRGAAEATGSASFRILIPEETGHHDRWVSPSTKSISIAIRDGAKTLTIDRNLAPHAPGCIAGDQGTACTIAFFLPAGRLVASITTYAGKLRHGKPTGSILSADQRVPLHIKGGKKNQISVTLGGLPASVEIDAGTGSSLTGTAATGFGLSKCAQPQAIVAISLDSHDNYIVGPGAPTMTLVSSDPAHLAVAAPSTPEPNTFTLSLPAIPNAHAVVQLTATATPVAHSGGTAKSATANVTFNGDICGTFTEFPAPAASPEGMALGSDGNLWFAEDHTNKIARMTTAGAITEFPIPTAASETEDISPGSDGNLWFAEIATSKVGRITTAGVITEFPTPTANSGPETISAGPDGRMWFTEGTAAKIGAISTTTGAIMEYPVITSGSDPVGITNGPDGAVWFTEELGDNVGRITTSGTVIEVPYSLPGDLYTIVTGSDNNIWFSGANGLTFAQLIPSISPTITSYVWPQSTSAVVFITNGPDGAIWGADLAGNGIVRGSVTAPHSSIEYTVPTAASEPAGITTGPDGAIWFTESAANKIGRLQ